jgi:hypothetical protein
MFALLKINILYVLLPLLLTNIIHLIVIKYNVFQWSAIPLSISKFGTNKTWRGVGILLFVNAWMVQICAFIFPVYQLAGLSYLVMGGFLGLAYVIGELPNSYFKRKLKIKSGEAPPSFLFKILDKSDSSFAIAITTWLLLKYGTWNETFSMSEVGGNSVVLVFLFLQNFLTHTLFSLFFVLIKLKKSY